MTDIWCLSSTRRHGEDVADVVVHDEHLAAGEDAVCAHRAARAGRAAPSGSAVNGRCSNRRRRVEQPLRRLRHRTVTVSREARSSASARFGSPTGAKTATGCVCVDFARAQRLVELRRRRSATQSTWPRAEGERVAPRRRSSARGRAVRGPRPRAAGELSSGPMHDQRGAHGAARAASAPNTSSSARAVATGFVEHADRAELQGALGALLRRDDIHGDMARREIVLQAIEHAPAVDVRQADVERDRVRPPLAGERDGCGAERGRRRLPALRSRASSIRTPAKPLVVLDDEQHPVARHDGARSSAGGRREPAAPRPRRPPDRPHADGGTAARLGLDACVRASRPRGRLREVERERAAVARRAVEPDARRRAAARSRG